MGKQMDNAAEPGYSLSLDRRKHAVLTGVTDVESFDDASVVLHTHGGRLTLHGAELHVSRLQLENGQLEVDGVIDAAVYDTSPMKRRSWLRRGAGI